MPGGLWTPDIPPGALHVQYRDWHAEVADMAATGNRPAGVSELLGKLKRLYAGTITTLSNADILDLHNYITALENLSHDHS